MRILTNTISLLLLPALLLAQQPFICSGDFFLSLTDFGVSTQFYHVRIDSNTGNATFDAFDNLSTVPLNAIGYRSTDNLIYAVNPANNQLVQVDATGRVFPLGTLNLDTNFGYFGGDITTDGNTFVLTGNDNRGTKRLVGIDLTNPSFPIIFTHNLSIVGQPVNCTDIAFDPNTGNLYGFDSNGNRLVKIDMITGDIDNTTFPVSNIADRMGALFFNAFGELFGYGSDFSTSTATDLFRLDVQTGIITLEATGPASPGKDGCSCPYTVVLNKSVSQPIASPCTEVLYVFEIANQSSANVPEVDFLDEMPVGLTILEIIENPFGGNTISGVGTNVLEIENMNILGGVNELIIRVEVAEGIQGQLENQAILTNLPPALGGSTLSDDPNTIAQSDPTVLDVVPLFVDLDNQSQAVCNATNVTLTANTVGGVSYLWNDGSTNPTLQVDTTGTYSVRVDSGCEIAFDTITIVKNSLAVDLGEDLEIKLGDSILLTSITNGNGEMVNYSWVDTLENSLSCLDCDQTFARPLFDVDYQLTVTDENGCIASDVIRITVDKSTALYAATAFSPNGDGVNDVFFLQGRGLVTINRLEIFDRWGHQVFKLENGMLNDRKMGWDGRKDDKLVNPAVFVWVAEIELFDGSISFESGEVTLIR